MAYYVKNNFFRRLKIYSTCPNLVGIKDVLSECSGLVRLVGPCAQTEVLVEMHLGARGAIKCLALVGHRASRKVRGRVTVLCHTCLDSPVVSMFERSENVSIARRLLMWAYSCCWPAVRVGAYRFEFEVHSVCICMCILLRGSSVKKKSGASEHWGVGLTQRIKAPFPLATKCSY